MIARIAECIACGIESLADQLYQRCIELHIVRQLGGRDMERIVTGFNRPNLSLAVRYTPGEPAKLRDGLAGVGISKMSVASRTTVGGYDHAATDEIGQFAVNDARNVEEFCAALRANGLEPVFKNWDAAYR